MKADGHAERIQREFVKKMHCDILALIERRYRVSLYKVLFLSGLLGIGGSKLPDSIQFSPVCIYAILPLVAIFWDFLFFEQDFALKRISKFIRCREDEFGLESVWEKWLHGDYGEPVGKRIFHSRVPIYFITVVTIGLAWFAFAYKARDPADWIASVVNPNYYFPVVSLGYVTICLWDRTRQRTVMEEPACARIRGSGKVRQQPKVDDS